MFKEHSSFVKQASAVVDCVLILGAFYASYLIVGHFKMLYEIFNYWFMVVGFLGFYLYFAWTRSLFSILQFNWITHLFNRVVMIFLSAALLGAAILYIVPDSHDSRTLYVVFAGLSFVVISFEKLIIKQFFVIIRQHNRNITPIVIMGKGRIAAQIFKELTSHPEWGFRIVKMFDLTTPPAQFEEILRNCYTEEVFFCVPRSLTNKGFLIDSYLRICEEMGRPTRVFMNIVSSTRFASWKYHRFLDRSTIISSTTELDIDQMFFKRILDIVFGVLGFLGLVVVYPFLAIMIKITSPGPIFFKQVRVGRNGKRFILFKFRTMQEDAEKRKKELMVRNELDGAVFKMKNDPRVTRFGGFMRRFSLDELPQFMNILKGEMSIVGTRPPTPDEVCQYEKWHHRRISIRPGITGLWQVSGRNKISNFDDIVKLDLKYIDSWSLWLDLKIIAKTIFVIFQRDAAF
jgi:exopolysaccharide biosynthesis polyprenyl glycosylphosphotransferase